MAKFKYFSAFIVPLLGLLTFNTTGYLAYTGIKNWYTTNKCNGTDRYKTTS